jgi:hypothetical protein
MATNADDESTIYEPPFDTYDYESSETAVRLDRRNRLRNPEPEFKFDVDPWTTIQVLQFWEQHHGQLSDFWRGQFLKDPFVLEICNQHPSHIRESIRIRRKVANALAHIHAIKKRNLMAVEILLDDHRPAHAIGITNAHHGNRTTDPFDPERDDLLFKCSKCNLKLSLRRRSNEEGSESICKSCSGED